jgi:AcrR family transcriptional regulator
MARDSAETKRRIFEAATAEFTAHGIAGARVDRIAAAAGANKQSIYAYFGNKRRLFEFVVSEHVARFLDAVPFVASDLPSYAVGIFDFFIEHPEIAQLRTWHALEPGESDHRIPIIENAIRRRTREIRRAQTEGLVDARIPAEDLLAMVNALAGTWAVATPERNPRGGADARSIKRRRAAVVEATRRIVDAKE